MAVAPFPSNRPTRRYTYSRQVVRKTKKKVAPLALPKAWIGIGYVLLFCFVVAVTFGFSVLMGNSVMEHARREGANVSTRAKQAKTDVARLRERVDRQITMAAVDDWAKGRGFISPYGVDPALTDLPATQPTMTATRGGEPHGQAQVD